MKKLCARLSPNNSQISTDLVFSISKTESAKIYTNYRKKNLQSCLYIFSTNLKLPRMRYRKNSWNKIWDHPQCLTEKSPQISVLSVIKFGGPQIHPPQSNIPSAGKHKAPQSLEDSLDTYPAFHAQLAPGKHLRIVFSKEEGQYQGVGPILRKEGKDQQRRKRPTCALSKEGERAPKVNLRESTVELFLLNPIVYKCHLT